MNNVIALNAYAAASQPAYVIPTASAIAFHAYERPLYYFGMADNRYEVNTHKALIRMQNDKPVVLNVVRDTYKVIQNAELFGAIENGLIAALGEQAKTADIVDKIAHAGRMCYRQYIFRDINVESPEKDKIVFRVIIQNGFGGSAIKMHVGAIDMFCTNGMIMGDYTSEYAKHTAGVKITKFEDLVKKATDVFWKNKDKYTWMRDRKLTNEKTVQVYLNSMFGERLGDRLYRHYLIERTVRGGSNMWALYSALTYYASHNVGSFATRNTKNDHVAATMIKREHDVLTVLNDEAFQALAA